MLDGHVRSFTQEELLDNLDLWGERARALASRDVSAELSLNFPPNEHGGIQLRPRTAIAGPRHSVVLDRLT